MPVTNFFWDSDNILQEYDEAGTTIANYSTEPGSFGRITCQRRNGVHRYYHYDPLGSTTELTDSSGEITDVRRYDAFGAVVEQSGSTHFPFQYAGQSGYYFDAERGTHYIRRRDLDTTRGRWLTKEPLTKLLLDGYVYVRNSPIDFLDPTGQTLKSIELHESRLDQEAKDFDEDPAKATAVFAIDGCAVEFNPPLRPTGYEGSATSDTFKIEFLGIGTANKSELIWVADKDIPTEVTCPRMCGRCKCDSRLTNMKRKELVVTVTTRLKVTRVLEVGTSRRESTSTYDLGKYLVIARSACSCDCESFKRKGESWEELQGANAEKSCQAEVTDKAIATILLE